MCGIIGFASINKTNIPSWFLKGRDELKHRGPDSSGYWNSSDHRVFLGHTRLSVIDLSEYASQPMIDEDSGNAIIFNGEIYNFRQIKNELISLNYKFKTESDTEVLLAAYNFWKEEFLKKIDGMFALAIYDKSKNILLLARDRFGQKPLYYHETSTEIKFASEVKSLLLDSSLKRELNFSNLNHLLCFGYNKNHSSLIKNIKKITPGSYLTFNLNNNCGSKIENYWLLSKSYHYEKNNFSDEDHTFNINNILKKNFKNYLISDVPLCILSSGGIDSSIMTAFAADCGSQVNTFHIKLSDNSNIEDTKNSKLISDFFKTNHHEIEIDFNRNLNYEKILSSFDEPIFDSSLIPTFLISEQISKSYKVAIGGDGGDELFGGYNKYQYLKFFENLQMFIPNSVFSFFNNFYGERSKKFFKGRNVFSILKNNLLDDRYHYQYFSDDFNFLNNKKLKNQLNEEHKNLLSKDFRGNLVDSLIYDDLKSYLPNNILYKLDTCSMANSLELRSPFLNNDLVDYVLKYINCNLKVSALDKKIILKKLAKKILPKKFNINRKLGFSVPLNIWLRSGHLRNYSYDILMSSDNYTRDSINKLFISLDEGNFVGDKIFSLLVFDRWLNNYNLNLKELS